MRQTNITTKRAPRKKTSLLSQVAKYYAKEANYWQLVTDLEYWVHYLVKKMVTEQSEEMRQMYFDIYEDISFSRFLFNEFAMANDHDNGKPPITVAVA